MLNKKELEELKEKLLAAQKEIAKTLAAMPEVPDSGSDVEGEEAEEEADEAEDYSNQLAEKQSLKERLLDIKNALDKIHSGTYGKCENCGEEIETAVLKVDPESRFCKKDKK